MRTTFLIMLCFISIIVNGQRKFVIGTNGAYALLLAENASSKSMATENGYVDYYVTTPPNGPAFMISITNTGMTTDENAIYGDDFRLSFSQQCNCRVLEYKKTRFNNFEALILKIKATVNEKAMEGYSLATVNSSVVYSVNFLTSEPNLELLTPEFQTIMNSLIFK